MTFLVKDFAKINRNIISHPFIITAESPTSRSCRYSECFKKTLILSQSVSFVHTFPCVILQNKACTFGVRWQEASVATLLADILDFEILGEFRPLAK